METVLKHGSTGAAVSELQRLLNLAGASPPLAVDGHYGHATDAGVQTFQVWSGLVVDGIAGPQTMAALLATTVTPVAGKREPTKLAMAQAAPETVASVALAAPPPNAASLVLLPTTRPIHEIIVHCTATPEGKDYTVDDIRAWHKARGWSDIGYHYVVYRDGRVMVGRPVGQVGSHVAGHNSGTIGVTYVGGVSSNGKTAKDTRTAAQRGALLWLVAALARVHPGVKKVSGHNQYAAKACPSFDVRKDPLGALV